jgi:hypothetical protein
LTCAWTEQYNERLLYSNEDRKLISTNDRSQKPFALLAFFFLLVRAAITPVQVNSHGSNLIAQGKHKWIAGEAFHDHLSIQFYRRLA